MRKKICPCKSCGKLEIGRSSGYRNQCDECTPNDEVAIKDRAKNYAYGQVKKARVQGLLPDPWDCLCADCGKQASVYDHRDYAKPLEVDPVCKACNVFRGPAVGWRNAFDLNVAALIEQGYFSIPKKEEK